MPLEPIYEKTACRQKGNKSENVLQISVQVNMTTTKQGLFQLQKTKWIRSLLNYFRNPVASVSIKVQSEKISTQNLTLQITISFQLTLKTYSPTPGKKEFPISFVYIWTPYEHKGARQVGTSRKSSFFKSSLSRNTFPAPAGHQNAGSFFDSINSILKQLLRWWD